MILQQLREASSKPDAMRPITIRLPLELESEIREFCAYNSLAVAVVVRECISRGWRSLRDDLYEEYEEGAPEE